MIDKKETNINDIKFITIEEQDKILAKDFINNDTLTIEEFDSLYWQLRLIHQSIDYQILRKYSYLRLKNSTENVYHNLLMDITDDKDGIYKQVKISTEDMITSIEQCKNLSERYYISEKIEFWNEFEVYFSRTLLKTNYPQKKEFIPIAFKKWLYNPQDGITLPEEIESENYTKTIQKKSESLIKNQEEQNKVYVKCLSKNK